ncbi:hypothetical protein [Arthrobacter bambusae]|uniref:hypothetical protein n=1 Tax=Arthrobacter bambusae TaxID=1338426 RepID=UPI00277EAA48|nr:hypothetical protein [Arthrobacter bambusae]MDQ0028391.1 hypothetical protein [Arthrobacter bambusae]MDQ0096814.1 hypothetical protein [Arthrobacter bambusae]
MGASSAGSLVAGADDVGSGDSVSGTFTGGTAVVGETVVSGEETRGADGDGLADAVADAVDVGARTVTFPASRSITQGEECPWPGKKA